MLPVSRLTALKVYGAIGLMFFATQIYAEEHTHKPGKHTAEHKLNHGKKWETDEVLRQGMENIRQVMAKNQEAIEKDRLGTQDYQRIAETVDKAVASIVKGCKLTKEADAAFHSIVLADLTNSSELMRTSPKTQAQRVGALGIQQSLRKYGEYFEHPGWRPDEVKPR